MKAKLTEIMLAGFFTLIGVLLGTTLNDALSRYQWRTETRFEIYSELTLELTKYTSLRLIDVGGTTTSLYKEMSTDEIKSLRSLITRARLVASPALEKELLRLDGMTSLQAERGCDGGWCPSRSQTTADFISISSHVFTLMQNELK